MESSIETLMDLNCLLKGRATIAGGCFRSLIEGNEPKDVDIFLVDKNDHLFPRDILRNFTGLDEVETTYSWEYGKYTIIKPHINNGRKLYGKPCDLISEFDIDVTKIYMNKINDLETIEPYSIPMIAELILNRQCSITLFEGHEKRTINRINKYIGYGYNVSKVESKPLHSLAFYVRGDYVQLDAELAGTSYNDEDWWICKWVKRTHWEEWRQSKVWTNIWVYEEARWVWWTQL